VIFETVARPAYPSPMLVPKQDTVKDWMKGQRKTLSFDPGKKLKLLLEMSQATAVAGFCPFPRLLAAH